MMNPDNFLRVSGPEVGSLLQRLRTQSPLVHNITNYVVMNATANALLAVGASPLMAHATEELDELLAIAGALVINIGTLDRHWGGAMVEAVSLAGARSKPVVLDPVGAGASRLRTDTARRLLETGQISLLRGNASEILALGGITSHGRGVDAHDRVTSAFSAAEQLATDYNVTVCISGAMDLIISGKDHTPYVVEGGHPIMTRVTGMGCTASAVCAAFAAISSDDLPGAATAAMATMALAGERAAEATGGPGTFWPAFLDALHKMTPEDLVGRFGAMTEAQAYD